MAGAVGASLEVEATLAASRIVTSVAGEQAVVPILGTRALLRYRLDHHEDGRRRRANLGAIRHPEVLELLLGLPVGVSVPVASLTQLERAALRVAPPGAVAVSAASVTREAGEAGGVGGGGVGAGGGGGGLGVGGGF